MKLPFLSTFYFLLLWGFYACSSSEEVAPTREKGGIKALLNHNWDLYEQHLSINPDSAVFFMKEVQRIAKENREGAWLAGAYGAIGDIQYQQGFLGDAVFNFLEAAKAFKASGELNQLAITYNKIGAIYFLADDFKNAVLYYKYAADIFAYTGTNRQKAMVARNIASCNKELELYPEAIEHITIAMQKAIEANDFSTVSNIHNIQGIVFSEQGMYKKARVSYFQSIEHTDTLADYLKIKATAFNNIGRTYLEEGDFTEANNFLEKALSLKKEINDPLFTQSTLNLLAKIYLEKGEYEQAIILLEPGLGNAGLSQIDEEIYKGLSLLIEALIKLSEDRNQAKRATFIENLTAYSRKLMFYNSKLLDLRKKVETVSKQQALRLAVEKHSMGEKLELAEEKNKEIKYAFIVPVLLFIFALVSVFFTVQRNRKMRKILNGIDTIINKGFLKNR